MTIFEEIWQSLEAAARNPNQAPGMLKRLLKKSADSPIFLVYLGIRIPEMTRTFVIEVTEKKVFNTEILSKSKGFEGFKVTTARNGNEQNPDHFNVTVSSSSKEHNHVFKYMIQDIYNEIERKENAEAMLGILVSKLRQWQIFFEKQTPKGLNIDAKKGLYGELFFADKYLLNDRVRQRRLSKWWTSPKDRQHDFQFGNLSVEIKTTTSKQAQKIHIASEQQLDETQVEMLYLFFVSLSAHENYLDTLPALVNKIRNKLAGDTTEVQAFENGLLESGYSDAYEQYYSSTGYIVRKTYFFAVKDDFPRILEADLKRGVGNVRYSVDISRCLDFEEEETEVLEHLERHLDE